MARALGPTGQGVFTTVMTVTTISVLTSTLGSGTALRIRTRESPTDEDLRAYIALSIAGALVCAVAGPLIVAATLPDALSPPLLVLSSTLGVAQFLARQSADLIQSVGQTGASIFSMVVLTASQLTAFLLVWSLELANAFTAIACAIVGAICQSLYCLRLAPRPPTPLWAPGRCHLRELTRLGAVSYTHLTLPTTPYV